MRNKLTRIEIEDIRAQNLDRIALVQNPAFAGDEPTGKVFGIEHEMQSYFHCDDGTMLPVGKWVIFV